MQWNGMVWYGMVWYVCILYTHTHIYNIYIYNINIYIYILDVAPQHPEFLAAGWSFQVCCRKGPSWALWQRRYLCHTWPISGSNGLSLAYCRRDPSLHKSSLPVWFTDWNHTQLFWNYLGRLSSSGGQDQIPLQNEAVACIWILWWPWKRCRRSNCRRRWTW